jgi:hypothetical protein
LSIFYLLDNFFNVNEVGLFLLNFTLAIFKKK